jgi:hypothetical protein
VAKFAKSQLMVYNGTAESLEYACTRTDLDSDR